MNSIVRWVACFCALAGAACSSTATQLPGPSDAAADGADAGVDARPTGADAGLDGNGGDATPPCQHCAERLSTAPTTGPACRDRDGGAPSSYDLVYALAMCVCNSPTCADMCADTCASHESPNADCLECMHIQCATAWDSCAADTTQ